MFCPKCNNDQAIEFSYAAGTYNCPSCSGCWMEYSPYKKYLEERDDVASEAFRSIWDLRAEQSSSLKCPQDNAPLYIFTYKGVELEFCQQCKGMWFDAKELENFSKNNPLEPIKDYSDSRESMRAFLRSPTPMEKDWQL